MRKPRSRAAIISVLLLAAIIFGLVYYAWNTATDIFQPVNANAKRQPFLSRLRKVRQQLR